MDNALKSSSGLTNQSREINSILKITNELYKNRNNQVFQGTNELNEFLERGFNYLENILVKSTLIKNDEELTTIITEIMNRFISSILYILDYNIVPELHQSSPSSSSFNTFGGFGNFQMNNSQVGAGVQAGYVDINLIKLNILNLLSKLVKLNPREAEKYWKDPVEYERMNENYIKNQRMNEKIGGAGGNLFGSNNFINSVGGTPSSSSGNNIKLYHFIISPFGNPFPSNDTSYFISYLNCLSSMGKNEKISKQIYELLLNNEFINTTKSNVNLLLNQRVNNQPYQYSYPSPGAYNQSPSPAMMNLISWDHFFCVLKDHIQDFHQLQNELITFSEEEEKAILSILDLIHSLTKTSNYIRIQLFDNHKWSCIQVLTDLLNFYVPIKIKSSIINVLTSFSLNKDILYKIWPYVEINRIFHLPSNNQSHRGGSNPSNAGSTPFIHHHTPQASLSNQQSVMGQNLKLVNMVQYEFRNVEAITCDYSYTISFLKLLNQLLNPELFHLIDISVYLDYIIDLFRLFHKCEYSYQKQKWKISYLIIRIMDNILSYSPTVPLHSKYFYSQFNSYFKKPKSPSSVSGTGGNELNEFNDIYSSFYYQLPNINKNKYSLNYYDNLKYQNQLFKDKLKQQYQQQQQQQQAANKSGSNINNGNNAAAGSGGNAGLVTHPQYIPSLKLIMRILEDNNSFELIKQFIWIIKQGELFLKDERIDEGYGKLFELSVLFTIKLMEKLIEQEENIREYFEYLSPNQSNASNPGAGNTAGGPESGAGGWNTAGTCISINRMSKILLQNGSVILSIGSYMNYPYNHKLPLHVIRLFILLSQSKSNMRPTTPFPFTSIISRSTSDQLNFKSLFFNLLNQQHKNDDSILKIKQSILVLLIVNESLKPSNLAHYLLDFGLDLQKMKKKLIKPTTNKNVPSTPSSATPSASSHGALLLNDSCLSIIVNHIIHLPNQSGSSSFSSLLAGGVGGYHSEYNSSSTSYYSHLLSEYLEGNEGKRKNIIINEYHLSELSYKLIYQLASNKYTSEGMLYYLRNIHPNFYQTQLSQLQSFLSTNLQISSNLQNAPPTPGDGGDHVNNNINQIILQNQIYENQMINLYLILNRSWLLKLITLEIHTNTQTRRSSQRILDYLFNISSNHLIPMESTATDTSSGFYFYNNTGNINDPSMQPPSTPSSSLRSSSASLSNSSSSLITSTPQNRSVGSRFTEENYSTPLLNRINNQYIPNTTPGASYATPSSSQLHSNEFHLLNNENIHSNRMKIIELLENVIDLPLYEMKNQQVIVTTLFEINKLDYLVYSKYHNEFTNKSPSTGNASSGNAPPLIDIKLLSIYLSNKLKSIENTNQITAGISDKMKDESIKIMKEMMKENYSVELLLCKLEFLESWKSLIEIIFHEYFTYIKQKHSKLIYELLENLLNSLIHQRNKLDLPISECILNLFFHLHQLFHSGASYFTPGADLPLNKLHYLLQSVLKGLFLNGSSQELRGNLYSSLSYYLRLTRYQLDQLSIENFSIFFQKQFNPSTNENAADNYENENQKQTFWWIKQELEANKRLIFGNIDILEHSGGDKLIELICQDASDGFDVWKSISFSLLDSLISYDRKYYWLEYLEQRGYLRHFIDDLLQQDQFILFHLQKSKQSGGNSGGSSSSNAAGGSPSSSSELLRLIYVYQSKLSLFLHISQTIPGSNKLISNQVLVQLSECKFIDYLLLPEVSTQSSSSSSSSSQSNLLSIENTQQLLLPILELISCLLNNQLVPTATSAAPSSSLLHVLVEQSFLFIKSHFKLFKFILSDRFPFVNLSSLKQLKLTILILFRLSKFPKMQQEKLQNKSSKLQNLLVSLLHRYLHFNECSHFIFNKIYGGFDFSSPSSSSSSASSLATTMMSSVKNHVFDICEYLVAYCTSLSLFKPRPILFSFNLERYDDFNGSFFFLSFPFHSLFSLLPSLFSLSTSLLSSFLLPLLLPLLSLSSSLLLYSSLPLALILSSSSLPFFFSISLLLSK